MSVDEPLGPVTTSSVAQAARLGIGVIGAGKVGAVLARALVETGHTVTAVHAVSEASRTRADALLPEAPILEIPEILRRSEMVLFAVPDDVLVDLVAGLAEAGHFQTGHLIVHTSGRHGLTALHPVREHGAIPLAIHPAMTFTGMSMDLERLKHCAFGVTADPVMLPIAQALVVEMGGEPVPVAEADRPAYHAAMSHAANHLVTLTAQAKEILNSLGVEAPEHLLRALMTASLENALSSGDAALTGPVARGDVGTVADHITELARRTTHAPADTDDERFQSVNELRASDRSSFNIRPDVLRAYRAMSLATVERAEADSRIKPQTAAELRAVLEAEPETFTQN